MKQFKVIKSFNLFVYNAKNRSHKMIHYDIGDKVNESVKLRLHNPQTYLK